MSGRSRWQDRHCWQRRAHHRGIGHTWTEVPGARTRDEFMRGLFAGWVRVSGRMGSLRSMASDVCRFAANYYIDQICRVVLQPLDWRGHALLFGGVFGLPVIPVAVAGAYLHFVAEQRFNRNLLFDLVARPARATAQVPGLAA